MKISSRGFDEFNRHPPPRQISTPPAPPKKILARSRYFCQLLITGPIGIIGPIGIEPTKAGHYGGAIVAFGAVALPRLIWRVDTFSRFSPALEPRLPFRRATKSAPMGRSAKDRRLRC